MKWLVEFMWRYSRMMGNALTALGLLGLLVCIGTWIRIYADWVIRTMNE